MEPNVSLAACTPRALSAREVGLIAWSALLGLVAALTAAFVPGTWYARIDKPAWAPAAWLFSPLSMALDAALALAAWMIWREARPRSGASLALCLFAVALVLDVMWSWAFFGLHQVELALGCSVLLAVVGSLVVVAFGARRAAAGWLVAPWLAWHLLLGATCGAIA